MAGLQPELKERLKAAGAWGDYVQMVSDLKLQGIRPFPARKEALLRYLPGYAEELEAAKAAKAAAKSAKRPIRAKKPVEKVKDADKPVEIADNPKEPSGVGLPREAVVVPLVAPEVEKFSKKELTGFEGKSAGEVDQIRWVARALGMLRAGGQISIGSCPDPAAWGLYKACMESPSFCSEFWRSMYTKLVPSRSQLEDKPDAVDERSLEDTCEKLMAAKLKAEGELVG